MRCVGRDASSIVRDIRVDEELSRDMMEVIRIEREVFDEVRFMRCTIGAVSELQSRSDASWCRTGTVCIK